MGDKHFFAHTNQLTGLLLLTGPLLLVLGFFSHLCLGDGQPLLTPCPADDPACLAQHPQTAKPGTVPSISEIEITIHPIFDESKPEENNALFRLVNRLHLGTHKSVISRDLLVKPGDPADEHKLAESERILRTRRYLSKASVRSETDGDKTKVSVDAYQVWTLLPNVNFSHAGGKSNYSLGLSDSNFLGYGKTLNVTHNSDNQRSGDSFEYRDPNTGWHQTKLQLVYENNSDGSRRLVDFERPYFALATPNAGGVMREEFDEQQAVYDLGEEVDRFGHKVEQLQLNYGSKIRWLSDDEHIHRWNLGHSERRDDFINLDNSTGLVTLPQDREFKTTWAEYQFIRDGYIEGHNIQQINRVEDLNLGLQARLRLGYASSIYADYDGSSLLEAAIAKGYRLGQQQLLLANLGASGFYRAGQIYQGLASAQVDYHWNNFSRAQVYVHLEAARGLRLFRDQPLILGGETGLRGYPINYQQGDKRYLLTLEQRFFGEREWFSLFHLGFALFYDQGRAWGDSLMPQTQTGQLRDLGIGLRISGTRNGNRDEGAHNVLHLDLATPLDGDSNLSRLQWIVKVRQNF